MEISISDFMSASGKRNGSNWEHLKLHSVFGTWSSASKTPLSRQPLFDHFMVLGL